MKAPKNKKSYKQFLKEIGDKKETSKVFQKFHKEKQERLDQEFMLKHEENRVNFFREMGYSEERIEQEIEKLHKKFTKK